MIGSREVSRKSVSCPGGMSQGLAVGGVVHLVSFHCSLKFAADTPQRQ